jgi:hypothetical protein
MPLGERLAMLIYCMSIQIIEKINWLESCKKFSIKQCRFSRWERVEPTTSVVIVTDYIGSFESNYHAITATTAPLSLEGLYFTSFPWNNVVERGVKHH